MSDCGDGQGRRGYAVAYREAGTNARCCLVCEAISCGDAEAQCLELHPGCRVVWAGVLRSEDQWRLAEPVRDLREGTE